ESNKDPLLPLSDPEAIFWAANAERRRRIAAHAVETAINVPLPSTPTLQATTLPSRAVTPVLLLFQRLPPLSTNFHRRSSSDIQCPTRLIHPSPQRMTYEDDSTLYPELSSAAIATYHKLGALDASVQDVAFNNTDPRSEDYDLCG
ncbi:hypothetical protein PSHT_09717, partial [Puccinia striiformis]